MHRVSTIFRYFVMMNDLFKNKYRIAPARLQTWDYAGQGAYFITICTQNRECYFGEIRHMELHLSPLGEVAHNEWIKSETLRPDMNLELGEFIIMPNHVHGIIYIGENQYNARRDAMHRGSETPTNTPFTSINSAVNKFGPQSKNLSSIIRGFKSAVTTYARKNNLDFSWQTRFHDRIIRTPDECMKISEYIINNPYHWKKDEFYK